MTQGTNVVGRSMAQKEEERAYLLLALLLGLLLITVVTYLGLHFVIPSGGPLLPDTKARDDALAAIAQAKELLTAKVSDEDINAAFNDLRVVVAGELGEKLTEADNQALDEAFAKGADGLVQARKSQQDSVARELLKGLTEAVALIPWVNAEGVIEPNLAAIDVELNSTEPEWARIRQLLERIREEVQRNGDRGFWTAGWWRWLELGFWGVFGTLVFLLSEIRRWYDKIGEAGCSFVKFTPWYIINLVRGPIIAMLILVFLTSVQGQVLGVSISFTEAPFTLLIFLAGVLGYFSRQARDQLEILVEQAFPKAWARTRGGLSVLPQTVSLALGEEKKFTVEPDQDVLWSHSPAEKGTMSADGTFKAPTDQQFKGDKVEILATSVRDRERHAGAMVTLTSPVLQIRPVNPSVKFEQQVKFQVEPDVAVNWLVKEGLGQISAKGVYSAPKKGEPKEAQPGRQVSVTATKQDDKTVSATATVTLVE
jgi:hypothetical protein